MTLAGHILNVVTFGWYGHRSGHRAVRELQENARRSAEAKRQASAREVRECAAQLRKAAEKAERVSDATMEITGSPN